MNFLKIIEKEVSQDNLFSLTYYRTSNGVHKPSPSLSVGKRSYNEEVAKFYTESLNKHFVNNSILKRKMHTEDEIVACNTVLLPRNLETLKNYIAELKRTKGKIRYSTYYLLQIGAPVVGSNVKLAAKEIIEATYYTPLEHRSLFLVGLDRKNMDSPYSSALFSTYYHGKMEAPCTDLSKYFKILSESSFTEICFKIPILMALNDFVEFGGNKESLVDFFKNKDNARRVKENYIKGVMPNYKNTEKVVKEFSRYKDSSHQSFLFPTKGFKVRYKEIEQLTGKELRFWIKESEKAFMFKKGEQSIKTKFNLWLLYVKGLKSKNLTRDELIVRAVTKKFNDSLESKTKKLKEEKSIPERVKNQVHKINSEKLFYSNRNKLQNDILVSIVKSVAIKKDDFTIEDLSASLIYLLSESESNPGIFKKGSGSRVLSKIFLDTLETLDYDLEDFEEILTLLATSDSVSDFNNEEWLYFVEAIKEKNIEKNKGNLAILASIYIDSEKGLNVTKKGKVDIELLRFLKSDN